MYAFTTDGLLFYLGVCLRELVHGLPESEIDAFLTMTDVPESLIDDVHGEYNYE